MMICVSSPGCWKVFPEQQKSRSYWTGLPEQRKFESKSARESRIDVKEPSPGAYPSEEDEIDDD